MTSNARASKLEEEQQQKKAYQLVKDLTCTKKERTSTIQNKDGKGLTEDQDILEKWTEHCSELYMYNYIAAGDSVVLQVPTTTNNDIYPILREEIKVAVKSLKKEKSVGTDNIPGELVQTGGEAMIRKCPFDHLQQGMANSRVANKMDPVLDQHTPQERQSAVMSKL